MCAVRAGFERVVCSAQRGIVGKCTQQFVVTGICLMRTGQNGVDYTQYAGCTQPLCHRSSMPCQTGPHDIGRAVKAQRYQPRMIEQTFNDRSQRTEFQSVAGRQWRRRWPCFSACAIASSPARAMARCRASVSQIAVINSHAACCGCFNVVQSASGTASACNGVSMSPGSIDRIRMPSFASSASQIRLA